MKKAARDATGYHVEAKLRAGLGGLLHVGMIALLHTVIGAGDPPGASGMLDAYRRSGAEDRGMKAGELAEYARAMIAEGEARGFHVAAEVITAAYVPDYVWVSLSGHNYYRRFNFDLASILTFERQSMNVGISTKSTRDRPREFAISILDEELKNIEYSTNNPPSELAETTQRARMRDDLNTAIKKTKAETLAEQKPHRSAVRQIANYKALVLHLDLLNPELAEDERLRQARRLVRAYERVRERRPKFRDHSEQLLVAVSIVNKAKYPGRKRRREAKAALSF